MKMTHLEQSKAVSSTPHDRGQSLSQHTQLSFCLSIIMTLFSCVTGTSSGQGTSYSITESSPAAGTSVASVAPTAPIDTPQPAPSPHSHSTVPAESPVHQLPSLPQPSFPQTGISGATFLPPPSHLTLPVTGNVVTTHPPPLLPVAIPPSSGAPAASNVASMQISPLTHPVYSTPPLPPVNFSSTQTNPGLLASTYSHRHVPLVVNTTQAATHDSSAHPPPIVRDSWLSSLPLPLRNNFSTPAASASAVELSPPVVSPSELSLSPPPLSVALHVPSLPFQPPVPATSKEGLASVPYCWKAPSEMLSSTDSTCTSIPSSTTTAAHYSNASPSLLPPTSNGAPWTTATLAPPNLSVSLDPGSDPGEKDSVTSSTLDIEASLARMSSLARSVLEELAQDRGQLLQKLEPVPSNQYPNPSGIHSSLPSLSTSNSTPSIAMFGSASCALQPTDGSVELSTHEPASPVAMDPPKQVQTSRSTCLPTFTDTKVLITYTTLSHNSTPLLITGDDSSRMVLSGFTCDGVIITLCSYCTDNYT